MTSMTSTEFLEYMNQKNPDRDRKQALRELERMVELAQTDEGMKDLLLRAQEYYILKGSPNTHESILDVNTETGEQRRWRIMNTPYGL